MSAQQLTEVRGPNHVKPLIGLGAIGAVLLAIGFALEGARGWASLLLVGGYGVMLCAAATLLIALGYVTGAGWSVVVRRVPEAIGSALPWMALVLAPAAIGIHALYHWSHHEVVANDPVLAVKEPWLNVPFFLGRAVGYVVIWSVFGLLLRRHSVAQDRDGDPAHHHANVRWSTAYLFVYGLTMSAASFDWFMSLDPHWFSTMFAVENFAGSIVAALAVVLLTIVLMKRGGALQAVNEHHITDLSRLLFGFCCFWAYIWFCQFLLIWYANLPEETNWYVNRSMHGWGLLFWVVPILLWVVPFFGLLTRQAKRSESAIIQVAIAVLVGRWLDLYVTIQPAVSESPTIGFSEIGATLFGISAMALAIGAGLRKAALVPQRDPFLEESLHHHIGPTI